MYEKKGRMHGKEEEVRKVEREGGMRKGRAWGREEMRVRRRNGG